MLSHLSREAEHWGYSWTHQSFGTHTTVLHTKAASPRWDIQPPLWTATKDQPNSIKTTSREAPASCLPFMAAPLTLPHWEPGGQGPAEQPKNPNTFRMASPHLVAANPEQHPGHGAHLQLPVNISPGLSAALTRHPADTWPLSGFARHQIRCHKHSQWVLLLSRLQKHSAMPRSCVKDSGAAVGRSELSMQDSAPGKCSGVDKSIEVENCCSNSKQTLLQTFSTH